MTEILTESFCERCGTRYTFETKAARSGRGRGFRTLSSGLKNFVLSDDTSLGDAMAAARSEQDREVTNQQLDAFHKTFNFCMQCRQYTCANCWNESDGFCLTCAPHLGHEVLPAPFPDAATSVAPPPDAERTPISAEAWPALDLSPAAPPAATRPEDIAPPAPDVAALAPDLAGTDQAIDPVARLAASWAAPIAEADAPEEPVPAFAVDPTPEPDAEVVAEPAVRPVEAVAEPEPEAIPEPEAVATFAVDPAPEAMEPAGWAAQATPDDRAPAAPPWIEVGEVAAQDAAGQEVSGEEVPAPHEALAADAAEQEQAAAAELPAEPEWPAAEVPEAVEAGSETRRRADGPAPHADAPTVPAPSPVQADAEPSGPRPAEDVVAQPVWRIVAPDEPMPGVPASNGQPVGPPPVVPPASGEPQWPTASADRLDFLRRPRPAGDLWTASTQDLLAQAPTPAPGASGPVALQACSSCGLSLSATARFCRRCGTRQG